MIKRCSYSKKFKATTKPACGCLKCETKWALEPVVRLIVNKIHVCSTNDAVVTLVTGKLRHTKDHKPNAVTVEAVTEMGLMIHAENFKTYMQVMKG